MGRLILPIDLTSNVIDPVALDFFGREEGKVGQIPDAMMTPKFYGLICKASYRFQMGDWRRRRRDAEARNDFQALDRLDHEYELIGA